MQVFGCTKTGQDEVGLARSVLPPGKEVDTGDVVSSRPCVHLLAHPNSEMRCFDSDPAREVNLVRKHPGEQPRGGHENGEGQ